MGKEARELTAGVQGEAHSPMTKAENVKYRSVLLEIARVNLQESKDAIKILERMSRAQHEDVKLLEDEESDLFGIRLWTFFTNGGTLYQSFYEGDEGKEHRERYAARMASIDTRHNTLKTRETKMNVLMAHVADMGELRKSLLGAVGALQSCE